MTGGTSKPWWRDWRGLPPSMTRQRSEPLSNHEVWLWRLGWPAFVVAAVVIWQVSGSVGPLVMVLLVPIQWLKLTASQRRQVLGRKR